jgi:hypothetical protein
MQAVGIGDLHLTSARGVGGLASYIKDPDQMVKREVFRVLKWARKRGIKRCFLYGDVCEGPRMSYEAMHALLEILNQDFEFHIILGNHDLFAEDPTLGHSLELIEKFKLPNVRIYTEPTIVKLDGHKVQFLPWPHMDFDKNCLNVAHNDVKGARMDSGRPISKGSESKAPAVVGHIHTKQRVRNSYFSGTLYQTDFGQGPDKAFHHIEYDEGWVINDIPFEPEYRLHTVEARTRKDLRKVPRSEKDLVKLILIDGCQISAADTAGINVVVTKTANNAQELALAHVEELKEGEQVEVSTDEFFESWLESKSLEPDLRDAIRAYRLKKLKKLNK